jgi:Uncharacterized conserved protein
VQIWLGTSLLYELCFKGWRKAGVPKYHAQRHVAVEYYVVFTKVNCVISYKVYVGLRSSYHLYAKKWAFASNLDETEVHTTRFHATQTTQGQPSYSGVAEIQPLRRDPKAGWSHQQ